ncbi:protein far1-related sequence 5-like [Gigaspora margarita]|uniref:Protein far1-related sequence 5-like n=1 Tax=Gigaspora margarita TaxID=4874 RepID=A0A8H4ERL6_GIGMA|nr:protein far1-related sequence 5-like [Gigaspora margarita]
MGDIDWDSFITLPDIFNNVNLLLSFDYKDDDSIVNNINLCQSSCNYNNIVNTNLLPTFTEYYDYDNQFFKDGNNPSLFEDDNNPSIFEDDDNPSPLFEDGSNSLYNDNFNTSSSLLTKNDNNLNCKVAPITQLEMLKKKNSQHVFHKQDVYNAIYKLCKNINERLDSVSFLDTLFEKMLQDPSRKDLCFDTMDDNFIENVVDESQATLKAILSDNDISNINEMWQIRRIGGILCKENLWLMLYSSVARFYISIIPIRWYKDSILITLDQALKNLLSLIAIESSTDTAIEVNLNLQSLRNFQGSSNHMSISSSYS